MNSLQREIEESFAALAAEDNGVEVELKNGVYEIVLTNQDKDV